MGAARLELVHGTRPAAPSHAGGAPVPTRVRVIDGALAAITDRGVNGTTLEDVARQAGCSRATVYRAFPGGKDAVVRAVVDTEVSRFFSDLAVRMGAAADLEDVLVAGMTAAAAHAADHAALGAVLRREPELVLPRLAFAPMDEILAVACGFTAPFLGRWLDPAEARRVAEWAVRIVVSYLLCPAEGVDLTDAGGVRRLVRLFVLPGIRALSTQGAESTRTRPSAGRVARASIDQSDSTTKGEAS